LPNLTKKTSVSNFLLINELSERIAIFEDARLCILLEAYSFLKDLLTSIIRKDKIYIAIYPEDG
jgi:hypothetical protein